MCRLFGLHAGAATVDAEFWLLDAPDNLADQSQRNADGFGIGTFDDEGEAVIEKAPLPAWADPEFARAAHRLHGRTFVAHVRRASTGALLRANTHPFLQDGRLFAHNGALGGLETMERQIAALGGVGLVRGETDSERMFALITSEIRRRDGDVGAGIAAAVDWLQHSVPITSLNFVMAAPTDLWAFRSAGTNELFALHRPIERGALSARGSHLAARAEQLASRPSLVIASERMDADPSWRAMAAGELLHIGPRLNADQTLLAG